MNIRHIGTNIRVRPTNRKMKQAKHTAENSGLLPKEMPVKKTYLKPVSSTLAAIKDSISNTMKNIKRSV